MPRTEETEMQVLGVRGLSPHWREPRAHLCHCQSEPVFEIRRRQPLTSAPCSAHGKCKDSGPAAQGGEEAEERCSGWKRAASLGTGEPQGNDPKFSKTLAPSSSSASCLALPDFLKLVFLVFLSWRLMTNWPSVRASFDPKSQGISRS